MELNMNSSDEKCQPHCKTGCLTPLQDFDICKKKNYFWRGVFKICPQVILTLNFKSLPNPKLLVCPNWSGLVQTLKQTFQPEPSNSCLAPAPWGKGVQISEAENLIKVNFGEQWHLVVNFYKVNFTWWSDHHRSRHPRPLHQDPPEDDIQLQMNDSQHWKPHNEPGCR